MPLDGMKGLGDDAKGARRRRVWRVGAGRDAGVNAGAASGRGRSRRAAEGSEVAGRRGSRGSRKTTRAAVLPCSRCGGRVFESNSSHQGPKERFDIVATS
jgi:hypothetical protein